MVVSVRGAPRAALIFLHGSGDTGAGLQEYLRFAWHGFLPALAAAGVDCHFPSASPRPYRLAGGQTSSVWFDRYALEPTAREHTESIDESCTRLETLIDKIVASGVPEERQICHIYLTPHIPHISHVTFPRSHTALLPRIDLSRHIPIHISGSRRSWRLLNGRRTRLAVCTSHATAARRSLRHLVVSERGRCGVRGTCGVATRVAAHLDPARRRR